MGRENDELVRNDVYFDQVALSVEEAAKVAGTTRTAIYQALKRRALEGKKQGRRTIILRKALCEYLQELPDYAPKPCDPERESNI